MAFSIDRPFSNSVHRYQTVDDSKDTKGIAPPASWTVEDIETWLLENAITIEDSQIDPIIDLFDQGFDRYDHRILAVFSTDV